MFGRVQNPLSGFGSYEGIGQATGPVSFLSNVFQLVAIAAGLYALFNLIVAGFQYITSSGDAQTLETAQKRMNFSLLGLVIIVMSYAIAAIIGNVLFGRADFIFNPQIFGPGSP